MAFIPLQLLPSPSLQQRSPKQPDLGEGEATHMLSSPLEISMQEIKMRTDEFNYLSTAPFPCRQTFPKTQRFTVLQTVSFNCRQAFTESQGLQSYREHSLPGDRPTMYQAILVCLGVIFWVRFGFQFVLFLFLYCSFLVRIVFFFYLPI